MLGFYRHRGFIPWDYDFDVYAKDKDVIYRELAEFVAVHELNYRVQQGNAVTVTQGGCEYGDYHIDIFGASTVARSNKNDKGLLDIRENWELYASSICKCCMFDMCVNCLNDPVASRYLNLTFGADFMKPSIKRNDNNKMKCL